MFINHHQFVRVDRIRLVGRCRFLTNKSKSNKCPFTEEDERVKKNKTKDKTDNTTGQNGVKHTESFKNTLDWTHYGNDPLEEVQVIWISLVKDRDKEDGGGGDTKIMNQKNWRIWLVDDKHKTATEFTQRWWNPTDTTKTVSSSISYSLQVKRSVAFSCSLL